VYVVLLPSEYRHRTATDVATSTVRPSVTVQNNQTVNKLELYTQLQQKIPTVLHARISSLVRQWQLPADILTAAVQCTQTAALSFMTFGF
jgi:hypothetical protein